MSQNVTIELKGVDEALKRIEKARGQHAVAARNAVQKTVLQVTSDARILAPKDTSHLTRSITPEMEDGPSGRVFVNRFTVPYALYQEFGFSGTQQVRPHVRIITQAFGRTIPSTPVQVAGHSRNVNKKGRFYMTRAAERNERRFVQNVKEALDGVS